MRERLKEIIKNELIEMSKYLDEYELGEMEYDRLTNKLLESGCILPKYKIGQYGWCVYCIGTKQERSKEGFLVSIYQVDFCSVRSVDKDGFYVSTLPDKSYIYNNIQYDSWDNFYPCKANADDVESVYLIAKAACDKLNTPKE